MRKEEEVCDVRLELVWGKFDRISSNFSTSLKFLQKIQFPKIIFYFHPKENEKAEIGKNKSEVWKKRHSKEGSFQQNFIFFYQQTFFPFLFLFNDFLWIEKSFFVCNKLNFFVVFLTQWWVSLILGRVM